MQLKVNRVNKWKEEKRDEEFSKRREEYEEIGVESIGNRPELVIADKDKSVD